VDLNQVDRQWRRLYDSAPESLKKDPQNEISARNAGDVIVLDDDGAGHAAIVSSISETTVQIVNQNSTAVYSSASLVDETLTMTGWDDFTVVGVVHAPASAPPHYRDDVFNASGSKWRVSIGGSGGWQTMRTSGITTNLGVGDFDDDGTDDIFGADGNSSYSWRYWPGGAGSAISLKSSGTTMGNLRIGDFDG
jgi:hypothetical protein